MAITKLFAQRYGCLYSSGREVEAEIRIKRLRVSSRRSKDPRFDRHGDPI